MKIKENHSFQVKNLKQFNINMKPKYQYDNDIFYKRNDGPNSVEMLGAVSMKRIGS